MSHTYVSHNSTYWRSTRIWYDYHSVFHSAVLFNNTQPKMQCPWSALFKNKIVIMYDFPWVCMLFRNAKWISMNLFFAIRHCQNWITFIWPSLRASTFANVTQLAMPIRVRIKVVKSQLVSQVRLWQWFCNVIEHSITEARSFNCPWVIHSIAHYAISMLYVLLVNNYMCPKISLSKYELKLV